MMRVPGHPVQRRTGHAAPPPARVVRPLDRKRNELAVEVAMRLRALSGGQLAAAHRLLGMIAETMASGGGANRG
jgi:hypothetical protein